MGPISAARPWIDFCTKNPPRVNPRLPEHFFFVTRLPKVGWLPPPVNFKLTRPKYSCLVPYSIGSLLSIDTKIMKIDQGMTSQ